MSRQLARSGHLACVALSASALAGCGGAAIAAHGDRGAGKPASCLATVHGEYVPHNAWSQAARAVAPGGATALRLCRYSGFNASVPPGTLLRSRLLTRRALIADLIRQFDALKSPPPDTSIACPADDGSLILALLAYRGGERVTIAVNRTGCGSVSNGDVGALADGFGTPVGPRLERQLAALTA